MPGFADLGKRSIGVTTEQLVIGFSRGGFNGKSVFVWPEDVGKAWSRLQQQGASVPRGVMFWNINNDGTVVNGTNATCSLTRGFNAFLHVRDMVAQ